MLISSETLRSGVLSLSLSLSISLTQHLLRHACAHTHTHTPAHASVCIHFIRTRLALRTGTNHTCTRQTHIVKCMRCVPPCRRVSSEYWLNKARHQLAYQHQPGIYTRPATDIASHSHYHLSRACLCVCVCGHINGRREENGRYCVFGWDKDAIIWREKRRGMDQPVFRNVNKILKLLLKNNKNSQYFM